MSSVISVRIKRDLKEEVEMAGINIRDVIEKALSEELEKRRREEFKNALEEVLKGMRGIDVEEFTKAIKESRSKR